MTNLSVAAVVSHPIQYQVPLFRELSNREGIDLTVFFLSDHGVDATFDPGFGEVVQFDLPLLEGYDYEFVPNWSPQPDVTSITGMINPGILKRIWKNEFDIIWLHGWEALTHLGVVAVAKLSNTPLVVRGDSNGFDPDENWKKNPFKHLFLTAMLSSVDAFAAVGAANEKFYTDHFAKLKDIFRSPYAVDNEWFQSKKAEAKSQASLKRDNEIDEGTPAVLSVGKLVPRKQPIRLLKCFCEATDPDSAKLIFVGAGELSNELENLAIEFGREDDIFLPGFVDQSDLPSYYKMADIFALVSKSEPYGLVVNEAMNFGLPIICTEAVGAHFDLVGEENGIVVSPNDEDQIIDSINTLVQDKDKRKKMGENSFDMINRWGIEESATGLYHALHAGHAWS